MWDNKCAWSFLGEGISQRNRPFMGSFFQEWTSFFHGSTILNQLEWMCARRVFGKLSWRQRVKTPVAFFHFYVYHFNACWNWLFPGFLWQSSDKFLQVSLGHKAVGWIGNKINTAADLEAIWTTQVATSLREPLMGHICVISNSVLFLWREEKRVRGINSSAFTLTAQNFHSPG